MIQRDYILRLIDQLGALLRALLGSEDHVKKPEEPNSDAAQLDVALEKSCQDAMGLSFRTIREMPPDELMELLRSGGATWVSRCFFVGRLFEFDAEIAARLDERERAEDSLQRSLYFYSLLRANPEVPDEYHLEERFSHTVKLLAAFDPYPRRYVR
jgi:hypothetical protein